jgi:predicted metalloprotease with PDZ domain
MPICFPHEVTRSWNGKYRRPTGLATSNYNVPMTGELLWVYDGLTSYLGDNVLTPRGGLLSPEEYRERLATNAARLDRQEGRSWRPLEDAAISVQVLDQARDDYSDYRRVEDYYEEFCSRGSPLIICGARPSEPRGWNIGNASHEPEHGRWLPEFSRRTS